MTIHPAPALDAATILGLHVGSTAPVFLAVLAVHVPAGMVAVISGATAALSRKGGRRHVRAGRLYARTVGVVAGTALLLAAMSWPGDAYLAVLALISLAAVVAGVVARRRRPSRSPADDRPHLLGMGTSYVTLLTAFYVDNGPHLPGWDRLPVGVFWGGPAVIGGVLMARALRARRDVRTGVRSGHGTRT